MKYDPSQTQSIERRSKIHKLVKKLCKKLSSLDTEYDRDLLEQVGEMAGKFQLWSPKGKWTEPIEELHQRVSGLGLDKLLKQYFIHYSSQGLQELPDILGLVDQVKPVAFFPVIGELVKLLENRVQKGHAGKRDVDNDNESKEGKSTVREPQVDKSGVIRDYPCAQNLSPEFRLQFKYHPVHPVEEEDCVLTRPENSESSKKMEKQELIFDQTCLFLFVMGLIQERSSFTNLIIYLIDNKVKVPLLFLALVDPNIIHSESEIVRTSDYCTGNVIGSDESDSSLSSEYSYESEDSNGETRWATPDHYYSPRFRELTFFQILLSQRNEPGNARLVYFLPALPYWDANYYSQDQPSALSLALFSSRDRVLFEYLLEREDLEVSHNHNEILRNVILRGIFWAVPLLEGHENYVENERFRGMLESCRAPVSSESDLYPYFKASKHGLKYPAKIMTSRLPSASRNKIPKTSVPTIVPTSTVPTIVPTSTVPTKSSPRADKRLVYETDSSETSEESSTNYDDDSSSYTSETESESESSD